MVRLSCAVSPCPAYITRTTVDRLSVTSPGARKATCGTPRSDGSQTASSSRRTTTTPQDPLRRRSLPPLPRALPPWSLAALGLTLTLPPPSVQYLAVSQKVLNSDKVLSQQSANVPNAVEESSCLMQADKDYMYIGTPLPPCSRRAPVAACTRWLPSPPHLTEFQQC